MPLKQKHDATRSNEMANFVMLAEKDPTLAIQMMLWKDRYRNVGMSVEITARDLAQFTKCVNYLEAKPVISIFQPGGAPAQEAQAAVGKRKAVPARAAIPPRDSCVVQLVDEDGNAITPIEDNEQDQAAGRAAAEVHRARERAAALANEVQNMAAMGDMSTALIEECCRSLRLLAQA